MAIDAGLITLNGAWQLVKSLEQYIQSEHGLANAFDGCIVYKENGIRESLKIAFIRHIRETANKLRMAELDAAEDRRTKAVEVVKLAMAELRAAEDAARQVGLSFEPFDPDPQPEPETPEEDDDPFGFRDGRSPMGLFVTAEVYTVDRSEEDPDGEYAAQRAAERRDERIADYDEVPF